MPSFQEARQGCDVDLDDDGIAGPLDLDILLGNWGPED